MAEQPTFLELIDAYATATAEARTAQNLGDIEHREREVFTSRTEIERRLNLAGADHFLAWRHHLDNDEWSRKRQAKMVRRANHPEEFSKIWGPPDPEVVKHSREDWT
jgi:hypothetical protein